MGLLIIQICNGITKVTSRPICQYVLASYLQSDMLETPDVESEIFSSIRLSDACFLSLYSSLFLSLPDLSFSGGLLSYDGPPSRCLSEE